ncbi:MAG TPA: helix-turn-helix transcriptional regulator [Flavobacteriales bacterium]|nr:helix-turn-helix transcriptional regulator [Flavobacteriales bacterium]HMR28614.1 helix-turn-helix transcriptional regulator [Flavobacteriales bacterium]
MSSPRLKFASLNERFIHLMERLGHSGYSFSKELGTSEAVISNIRKGKNPPNILLVEQLLNKYEAVSAEWLLTGRGRPFKQEQERALAEPPRSIPGPAADGDRLVRMEELLQRSIQVQLERNVLIDETMNHLQRQVIELDRRVAGFTKARRKVG